MSEATLPRRQRRLTGCTEPCRECGNQVGASHFGNGIGDRVKKYRVCFTCDFWLGMLAEMWMHALARNEGPEEQAAYEREYGRPLVIEGQHYVAFFEDGSTLGVRGFGGREGRFVMLGDRVETQVSSRNMWCQGEVPDHFQERMPSTAKWVSGYDLTPIRMGG